MKPVAPLRLTQRGLMARHTASLAAQAASTEPAHASSSGPAGSPNVRGEPISIDLREHISQQYEIEQFGKFQGSTGEHDEFVQLGEEPGTAVLEDELQFQVVREPESSVTAGQEPRTARREELVIYSPTGSSQSGGMSRTQ